MWEDLHRKPATHSCSDHVSCLWCTLNKCLTSQQWQYINININRDFSRVHKEVLIILKPCNNLAYFEEMFFVVSRETHKDMVVSLLQHQLLQEWEMADGGRGNQSVSYEHLPHSPDSFLLHRHSTVYLTNCFTLVLPIWDITLSHFQLPLFQE